MSPDSGDLDGIVHRRRNLRHYLLSEGLVDIIQLAETVSVGRHDLGIKDDEELFNAVRETYRELLIDGLAIVGDVKQEDLATGSLWQVMPWPGDPETIADRVITEWKVLGKSLGLNDVCWLQFTDEGIRTAEAEVPWSRWEQTNGD